MRDRILYSIFFLVVVGLSMHLARCSSISDKVRLNLSHAPFQRLSDYQFFSGKLSELTPNARVLPYALITPLFTDYAFKSRFVWMPEGTSAGYSEEGVFDFPEGSVLIKNFYYPDDFNQPEGKRRILETRLLINRESGWQALPYIWKEDQSEAFLDVAGDNISVSWIHHDGRSMNINYSVPNKNQCKSCHLENNRLMPIGPKARNLNTQLDYGMEKKNQLVKWREMGYLSAIPAVQDISTLADWSDSLSATLHDRAIAYLEVNCGHCHRPEGPAYTSGLHLTSLEKNPSNLGVCKAPVAAGTGSGGREFDVVPGQPEASILLYRMESMDPGVMMPELGRQLPHREGIALIKQWITKMEGGCR